MFAAALGAGKLAPPARALSFVLCGLSISTRRWGSSRSLEGRHHAYHRRSDALRDSDPVACSRMTNSLDRLLVDLAQLAASW